MEQERRRQEQLRKARILAAREQLDRHQQQLSGLVPLAQAVLKEAFVPPAMKEQANRLLAAARQDISRCAAAAEGEDPAVMEQACASLGDRVQAVRAGLDDLYARLPDAIAGERTRIEDAIADGIHLTLPDEVARTAERDEGLRREISSRMAALRALPLPRAARDELDRILKKSESIVQADFLKNYLVLDIDPFIERCRQCEAQGYALVRARYELLAREQGVAPEEFAYSVQGIQAMQTASAALEAAILEDRERACIHEALDDAMRGMGYRLIGDRVVVRPKTGRQVKHQLYSLQDGTAVDVTFMDNGQISMELGGIAHTDRLPTAEESAALTEDMQHFCQDYAQLEQRLVAQGIQADRLSVMPPEAQFARIINADRYALTEAVTDYETRTAHRHERQLRQRGE
ncbi:MAG: hypothetical protein ACI4O7_09150 [Aristaeellaceae bacterium]